MALVDVVEPFPSDINVALPQSIFFYPSIGFVVEILFHLIPFTLMWLIASRIVKMEDRRSQIFLCVLIVSLIEPVFQSFFLDSISIVKAVVVFLIIYGINARALTLFTRSGFVSMYTLRIAYYLLWHIIWGTYRLKVLF